MSAQIYRRMAATDRRRHKTCRRDTGILKADGLRLFSCVSFLVSLYVALLGSIRLSLADAYRFEGPLREVEASLLHRRLDLTHIARWNRLLNNWQSLQIPRAEVYVVNLWSLDCPACIAEMPLFARLIQGWKGQRRVRFLFVAEAISENEPDELGLFWQRSALQQEELYRTTNDRIRGLVGTRAQPLTLLLDESLVVRQAFVGAINSHAVGASIERLLTAIAGTRTVQCSPRARAALR